MEFKEKQGVHWARQWLALCHDSEPSERTSAFQEGVPSMDLAKFSVKRLKRVLIIYPDYTSFVIRQDRHFWHTSWSRKWETQKVKLTRQDTLRQVRLILFCRESDVILIRKSRLPTFQQTEPALIHTNFCLYCKHAVYVKNYYHVLLQWQYLDHDNE